MSKEQNEFAFRQIISEAFNKGNYEVLYKHFSKDYIEHQFGLHPTIDGFIEDIQYLRMAFPDLTLKIEDIATEGDKVWARMLASGTNLGGFMGKPNGKSFEATVFDLCKFEEGKVIEHWGSPDRFAIVEQLGLLRNPQDG